MGRAACALCAFQITNTNSKIMSGDSAVIFKNLLTATAPLSCSQVQLTTYYILNQRDDISGRKILSLVDFF